MTVRLSTIFFISSLLVACDPSSSGGGGGSGGSTTTDSSTGGTSDTSTSHTGGTGGTVSTGGAGGATTTSSETGGSGGTTTSTTSALCMDGGGGPAAGSNYPSDCPCRPEAEAYLPILAQAAVAKLESAGALCGSAFPVPAIIPAGTGYTPAILDGMDFHAGDEENGWVCLGFAPVGGVHCRYRYQVGSDYAGPLFGGPDPGPGGFEVTAEGDTNGDVITSMFSIAGTLDPQTGTITLSSMFEYQPDE